MFLVLAQIHDYHRDVLKVYQKVPIHDQMVF